MSGITMSSTTISGRCCSARKSLFAVVGDDYAEALACELKADQPENTGFVIDCKDQRFYCHKRLLLQLYGPRGAGVELGGRTL
jgi:hypothetical protein